jgi:hypothetical protein
VDKICSPREKFFRLANGERDNPYSWLKLINTRTAEAEKQGKNLATVKKLSLYASLLTEKENPYQLE